MNGDESPWKVVTLMFLPHQYEHFETLLDKLEGRADLIGTAALDLGDEFNRAISDYGAIKNVRSVGVTIAVLTQMALDWIAMNDADLDPSQWVRLESVFGTDTVPAGVGRVIREAIEKGTMQGELGPKNPWALLEFWAAEYLAS